MKKVLSILLALILVFGCMSAIAEQADTIVLGYANYASDENSNMQLKAFQDFVEEWNAAGKQPKLECVVTNAENSLEKQLARAIAPKPKILMFDEATSALDNLTQKIVSDSLDKLKCTRIVIAHRLSTIRQCDRIIYLEKGQIVEDGTYDELIAKNGKFAELVERQRLDN